MPPDLRPVMGPAPAAHASLTHREQARSAGCRPRWRPLCILLPCLEYPSGDSAMPPPGSALGVSADGGGGQHPLRRAAGSIDTRDTGLGRPGTFRLGRGAA